MEELLYERVFLLGDQIMPLPPISRVFKPINGNTSRQRSGSKRPERSPVQVVRDWIGVAALLASGVVGALTYQISENDSETRGRLADVEEKIQDHRIRLDLVNLVGQAIEQGTPAMCFAASELVLASNVELPFKQGLCETFLSAGTCEQTVHDRIRLRCELPDPPGREVANEEEYRTEVEEQLEAANSSSSSGTDRLGQYVGTLHDWDFDLFYCEGSSPSNQELARELGNALVETYGSDGRIRVRQLSLEDRERPGYQSISGYQVSGTRDELPMAEALIDIAVHEINKQFSFRRTTSITRWYISMFFCGEPENSG